MSHRGGHLGRSHSKPERERRCKEAEERAAASAALSPVERLDKRMAKKLDGLEKGVLK